VLATSAERGDGLDELKRTLAKRIRDKASATQRLLLDVTTTAERLSAVNGVEPARGVTAERRAALEEALAQAAGVPAVVDAVERSVSQRRKRAMAWPPLRLLGRFRKDPLADLHLHSGPGRSSVPTTTPVQRSRVDTTVRNLADDAVRGLTPPWKESVSRAATQELGDLSDALDRAVVGTDLEVTGTPVWVRGFGALQVLVVLAALVGLGWMVALVALQLSGSATPDPPRIAGLSLPLLLLVAGLAFGWALAAVSSALARSSAARAARAVDQDLRRSISAVATERVVGPLEAELAAYERARTALARVVAR
jgi:hypothetical protein